MSRDTKLRTRSSDRSLFKRLGISASQNWYRDLILFVLAILWLVLAINLSDTNKRVERGRHFAVGVTCAVESATAEAGKAVIEGSGAAPGNAAFLRNLEKLGYRPPAKAKPGHPGPGDLYVAQIAKQVQAQVGRKGARLIRKDGTLDCDRLEALASAGG
jgi:hypothetical protein